MKILEGLRNAYLKVGQKAGAIVSAPSRGHIQVALFVTGVTLLAVGLATGASAQVADIHYNDVRIAKSVNAILTYLEGTFGALVMVAAGLGAILSSAFGQYRAALGCLIVAVGAFILRSVMGTFFNDTNIQQ
jgi:hypothetical protein